MKMKSINKILASVLSASMLIGGAMTVLADNDWETSHDADAPIYSFDVTNIIVPTTYAVAFNPQGLTVKTDDNGATSTDQILSKSYGIINKSTKTKLITVTLTVTDKNTGSGVTFVDSAQDVTDAGDSEYKIHLTVIPADASEVKIGTASADQTTAATDLNNVAMDQADSNAVTLKAGENKIGFKLEQAVWDLSTSGNVQLGTTTGNDVSSNYEVKSLATGGKGITAFTFGGTMNGKADWTQLTQGITITVVYDVATAASDLTVVSGTGAMVELNAAPTFSTGSGFGEIKYTAGAGDNGLKEITKVEMTNPSGKVFDGYNAYGTKWPAATDSSGVITLSSEFLAYYTDGSTVQATVTYETNGGETKTATVTVNLDN